MSVSAQFRTHSTPSSTRRRYDLLGVACLVSSADRCSVSSVWACVSVRVLLCAVCLASGTACPDACAMQAVLVRWGHPGGMGPEARVGVVSPVSSDQNKKGAFFSNTNPTFTNQNPSDCASLQKFQKIQKDPFLSLYCGIIS